MADAQSEQLTLFDVVRAIGDFLAGTRHGTVVSGGTNLITDSTYRYEADDFWNRGTALIVDTTDDAAPKGEWAVIDDWTQSTSSASLKSLLTAAAATGDEYMFIIPKYPIDQIKAKINQVLAKIRIVAIDTTSLDITAEQTEYSLPSGYTRSNLRQVWVKTNDDDDKQDWMRLVNWHVEYDGSSHTLILDTRIGRSIHNQYNGNDIKLIACPYHTRVQDADDTLDDLIHLDLVAYKALELLLVDEYGRNTGDKFVVNRLNWVAEQAELAKSEHPIHLPEWHEKGSGW